VSYWRHQFKTLRFIDQIYSTLLSTIPGLTCSLVRVLRFLETEASPLFLSGSRNSVCSELLISAFFSEVRSVYIASFLLVAA